MAASIALIRSSTLLPIVAFLDRERLPYEPLFEAVKLSPRIIERPSDFFPLAHGFAVLEKIARVTGIEDVGALIADNIDIADFGQLGSIVCAATNLFDMLQGAIEGAIAAHNTSDRLSLEWRGDDLFLRHKFATRIMPGMRHANAYTIVVMIKAVQLALGEEWKPDLILLPENERIRKRHYEARFKTELSFESDTWGIHIPPFRLADPIRKGEFSKSMAQAERSPADPPIPDFVGSLREMIRPSLRLVYPDIAYAAALAGISVSTLQRRLREVGLTYSELIETERLGLAIELLAMKNIRVCDVALELGYSEQANFTRAFRTWTGVTPTKFRSYQVGRT